MNKPEYLHAESLVTAVLAGHTAGVPDLTPGDPHEPEGSGDILTGEMVARRRGEISDWLPFLKSVGARSAELQEWYSECVLWGNEALQNSVEIDPNRRGGVPVLKGTRFTVGQTLAELADSAGVPEVAKRFDLDEEVVREFLYGLALLADKPRP
jgi:uncharacterized protein (DUF433 family)